MSGYIIKDHGAVVTLPELEFLGAGVQGGRVGKELQIVVPSPSATVGSNDPRVFRTTQIVNIGSMSAPVDSVPFAGLIDRELMGWYIEPWSANCERLDVDTFSSGALQLASSTKIQHANDSLVVCQVKTKISPHMYGAYMSVNPARNFPDEWQPLQRMILEHKGVYTRLGAKGQYNGITPYRPVIFPDQTFLKIGHIIPRSESFDPQCRQTGIPNDWLTGSSAVIKTAGTYIPFTAAANGDITLSSAPTPDLIVGYPIILNNPYPDPFPGGVVSGRTYLIKSWNPSTRVMTISEITTPTVTKTFSSTGKGYTACNFKSEVLVRTEKVDMDGGHLGWIAAQLCLAPGSTTADIRTGDSTIELGGRKNTHINFDVQTTQPDEYGVYMEGDDITIDYLIQNGFTANGLAVTGRRNRVKVHHTESITNAVKILPGCYDFRVDQAFKSRMFTDQAPYILDQCADGECSWEVGRVYSSLPNSVLHKITGVDDNEMRIWDGLSIADFRFSDKRGASPGVRRDDHGHVHLMASLFRTVDLDTYPTVRLGISIGTAYVYRGTGTLILPNCAKFVDKSMVIHKDFVGGSIIIKDHLGNTVYTMTAQEFKYFRWLNAAPYWTVTST
jgi:hypothetical protein